MKRWAVAFAVLLLCCVSVFLARSSNSSLLEDSDTRGILSGIIERNQPLSWFTSDWPIKNHFYRPISTLTFEFDHRVWGTNAAGFGLTNVLLCILSIAAFFWLSRELTDSPLLTSLSTVVFTIWHGFLWPTSALYYALTLAMISLAVPPLIGRRDWKALLTALLVLAYTCSEIYGIVDLRGRMIGWIPGRTASTMTLFALASIAAYVRFERRGAQRQVVAPSALDEPASKSTRQISRAGFSNLLWILISCVCLGLALCSYEQAVMVPALLVGSAIWLSLLGYRVRWHWHILFWLILASYLLVRHQVIPTGTSTYQTQQFRSGPGVWISIVNLVFPAAQNVFNWTTLFELGVMAIVASAPTVSWIVANNVATAMEVAKNRPMALGAWAMSIVAFLPMAWLKPFDHYYYLPSAFRALFVTALMVICYRLMISAWSPRALQAPQRLDPAPGSLPHR